MLEWYLCSWLVLHAPDTSLCRRLAWNAGKVTNSVPCSHECHHVMGPLSYSRCQRIDHVTIRPRSPARGHPRGSTFSGATVKVAQLDWLRGVKRLFWLNKDLYQDEMASVVSCGCNSRSYSLNLVSLVQLKYIPALVTLPRIGSVLARYWTGAGKRWLCI